MFSFRIALRRKHFSQVVLTYDFRISLSYQPTISDFFPTVFCLGRFRDLQSSVPTDILLSRYQLDYHYNPMQGEIANRYGLLLCAPFTNIST